MSELKTDPFGQQCLACDQVMFSKGLVDDKDHIGRAKGRSGVKLESDDADWYYVCPHCGAKNVVLPQLHISHVKQ